MNLTDFRAKGLQARQAKASQRRALVAELKAENPTITAAEIQAIIAKRTGEKVNIHTIYRDVIFLEKQRQQEG